MTVDSETGYVCVPNLCLSAIAENLDAPAVSAMGGVCRAWRSWFDEQKKLATIAILNHVHEGSDPDTWMFPETRWKSVQAFVQWKESLPGKYQVLSYSSLALNNLPIKILPNLKTLFPNLNVVHLSKKTFTKVPKWAVDSQVEFATL